MRDNKYITQQQYEEAIAAPLGLHPGATDVSQSQYFMDIASDEAPKLLEERQPAGAANVYTTIDLRLQRAAEQAIEDGMQLVDKQLASRRKPARGHAREESGPHPQVALIDLSLPDARGLVVVVTLHDQLPQLPIVVLSGLAD